MYIFANSTGFIKKVVRWFFNVSQRFLLRYYKGDVSSKISTIRKESGMLLWDDEAFMLYSCARATEKIPGDIAEVGTYRGGSTKVIALAKGGRSLITIDTFSGVPKNKDEAIKEGAYKADYEKVKQYLAGDATVVRAVFPDETKTYLENRKFSFVHLDTDVYDATAKGLDFFFERMSIRGGVYHP